MKVLITGGAGFIGINAASRYLARGDRVSILDNLSRPGTEANLRWLQHRGAVEFLQIDLRDGKAVEAALREQRDASLVLHLAGQVAVTTSVAVSTLGFRDKCSRDSERAGGDAPQQDGVDTHLLVDQQGLRRSDRKFRSRSVHRGMSMCRCPMECTRTPALISILRTDVRRDLRINTRVTIIEYSD